ncbi:MULTISPECIES: BMP family ABC transporter substrate-binding protein [unclassified Devosia]|uniref:BMP family ABC transporter substrate-binding protein n=1 Tax=unclassified Devosia TaxID=196773 RepID=UPI00145D60E7|nr:MULTISPECIES: BMP family ABC transporter substrate-binding protein [unclassified Devosia]MBJ6987532.1 BMP family ABC transporter substrate-binding protein [Devosia sp. MC521]QMW61890.1 BMP family ABC transporter substrate-binding protein [Devosia sp. MC521]
MTLSRRTFIKVGGAALSLPLLGSTAFGQEKLKIGFIYVGSINDNGYNYAHNQGRIFIQEQLGEQVETMFVENVAEGPDCERVLRELAQQGCKLIFATSFGFGDSVIKVAEEFPDIAFEHATGYMSGPNVGLYNARFHEGRAICGIIAGHMSQTGKAGYIGSFPIPEVVMGINSFTLAARKINPEFTLTPVYISTWNDPAKEADAARAMIDQGMDIIAQHTDGPAALQVAAERGIIGGFGQGADMSAFAPDTQLTAIIDNWGPHYLASAKAVLDGSWAPGNTWEGLKEEVVTMTPYHSKVPEAAVKDAEAMRLGQIDGSVAIFTGPIKDHTGVERVAAGVTMTDAELLSMDWYVEGVIPPA